MSDPSAGTGASRAVSDLLRHVLEAGLRGPSGDNCQPWRLRLVGAEGFEMRHDTVRAQSTFDVDDLASRLALGAFLENATLAAATRGRALHAALDPAPDEPSLWARVALGPDAVANSELADAIPRRCTNRLRYEGAPLDDAAVAALRAEATPPTGVHVLIDRAKLVALARLVAAADRVRVEDRTAHEDVNRWFRWTVEEAERTRDGLDVRTLGITPGERRMLHFFRTWPRMRLGNLVGVSRTMARYTRRLMEQIGGAVLLTTNTVSPRNAVAAGRVMERVWLRATRLDLAAAPMAALPLFLLRIDLLGDAAFAPRHVARLRPLAGALRELFALDAEEHPLLLLRVGRAPQPAVPALRRPLEDLIDD